MKDRGVSIAGDGVEIGRLQIHMDSKRTSDIKNHILESRFDDNYESGVTRDDTKGWKIVRESLTKKNSRVSAILALKGTNSDMMSIEKTKTAESNEKINSNVGRSSTTKIGGLTIQHTRGSITRTPSQLSGLRIRNSHMGLRKSNMGIDQNNRIDEEGTSSTAMKTLNSNRQGWKVLRESIQRREFTDNLRESNLRLHEMDEIAFTGRSSVRRPSVRKESLSEQGKNFHPSIQQQYLSNQSKRKSVASAFGEMYNESDDSMGFATISIDSARRKSQAGSCLSGSMNQDIQLIMDLRRDADNKLGCCNLFKSFFNKN